MSMKHAHLTASHTIMRSAAGDKVLKKRPVCLSDPTTVWGSKPLLYFFLRNLTPHANRVKAAAVVSEPPTLVRVTMTDDSIA